MGRLDGKVCIITGAASGLGKQEAIRFAEEGAKLAICSRTESKLMDTKRICEEKGAEVLAMACDVMVKENLEALVSATVDRFGTIDVLVNNAHTVTMLLPFLQKSEDDLEIELKSSLYAYWRLMKLCYPYMKGKPGAGASIINFASKAGFEGTIDHCAYAAAKEAVRGLSRVVAREWGKDNIRVNTICPGSFTDNCKADLGKQTKEIQQWAEIAFKDNPFQRVGDPYEDVSPIVLFLASDDSRWMTGQNVFADGGGWITA